MLRCLSGSRFQLQLINGESQVNNDQTHLRVVEISSFKHLTHLSLLVTSANDHEIKNYLARRLQSKTVNQVEFGPHAHLAIRRAISIN